MKYLITENQLKNIVIKYLNNIDWKLSHSNNSEFPIMVYQGTNNEDPTFILRIVSHRFVEDHLLLIRSSFKEKLETLFGKESVGDDDEPNNLLMDWFSNTFDIKIDDYTYMDSQFMTNDD